METKGNESKLLLYGGLALAGVAVVFFFASQSSSSSSGVDAGTVASVQAIEASNAAAVTANSQTASTAITAQNEYAVAHDNNQTALSLAAESGTTQGNLATIAANATLQSKYMDDTVAQQQSHDNYLTAFENAASQLGIAQLASDTAITTNAQNTARDDYGAAQTTVQAQMNDSRDVSVAGIEGQAAQAINQQNTASAVTINQQNTDAAVTMNQQNTAAAVTMNQSNNDSTNFQVGQWATVQGAENDYQKQIALSGINANVAIQNVNAGVQKDISNNQTTQARIGAGVQQTNSITGLIGQAISGVTSLFKGGFGANPYNSKASPSVTGTVWA